MIEMHVVVNNKAFFHCSCCGAFLFSEDEEFESENWNFCPICGEPLYPE